MAFTTTERAGIRNYLGWNARWVQMDTALERAFSFVESSSSGGDTSSEDLARSLLAKIVAVEAEIDATHSRFKADKVGPITLNRREVSQLIERGESYIGQLARVFGVEVRGKALRGDLPTVGGNEQRQG